MEKRGKAEFALRGEKKKKRCARWEMWEMDKTWRKLKVIWKIVDHAPILRPLGPQNWAYCWLIISCCKLKRTVVKSNQDVWRKHVRNLIKPWTCTLYYTSTPLGNINIFVSTKLESVFYVHGQTVNEDRLSMAQEYQRREYVDKLFGRSCRSNLKATSSEEFWASRLSTALTAT